MESGFLCKFVAVQFIKIFMGANDFIITVTNNLEGCVIERYIDTVCANVVVGTNVFSDIAASLTDFFGGFSGSYKSKLELIYNEAIKELRAKAKNLGANAVVGFSIDFDEISGGGKSMFMVSVSGTACAVKFLRNDTELVEKSGVVSQEFIDTELKRRFIVEEINSGASLKPECEEFLFEHPQRAVVDNLLERYIHAQYVDLHVKEFIERYFAILPKHEILDAVYAMFPENEKEIGELINCACLFSPKHVLELAKNNMHSAIGLLNAKKDFYGAEDLVFMKEILAIADALPDTGRIQMVKGGLFSREHEVFICENGHESNSEEEFCEVCGINIKGLDEGELMLVSRLRAMVDILEGSL